MRFDLHTHFYPDTYFDSIRDLASEFSFGTGAAGNTVIKYRGTRFFSITPAMSDPKRRLAEMDRVGVDVQVVSVSTPNVYFASADQQPRVARLANDAYADLISAYPQRFKGFASMPMDDLDAALEELDRALGELKLSGVILLSNLGGAPLTDAHYRPFFEEANRRGLCIFLHPMLPVDPEPYAEFVLGPIIGFPCDTTLAVARMCYAGMLREFPDIRWIIGHAGGTVPWLMERMDNGYRDFAECRENIDELPSVYLKRLYYDTVTFSAHTLSLLRATVGADHMVMGSDFPHLLGSIDRAVSSIEDLDIAAAEKEAIFSATALSILNNV
jgi:aminocarboxymuconate-semialdehyde decarboxylase